ncbi:MAG: Protein lysine acetyltransferase Pat [Acidimicrobiales bacterium]|nr:Protein lysine acetyltransferase Pat [Acidimicrobiales bacterium]
MSRTLSEAASSELLGARGIPVNSHRLVDDAEAALSAAGELGYPVVAKLCGEAIAHKTERGLVRVDLRTPADVRVAASELLASARPDDGAVHLLVAPFVSGHRELLAGLHRDGQFGMTVMLGVGGILAEAIADVSVRLVPISRVDADEMVEELATQSLLGPFRGEPAVDRGELAELLVRLSDASLADPGIRGADLNPIVITAGRPLAVDALVEVDT